MSKGIVKKYPYKSFNKQYYFKIFPFYDLLTAHVNSRI